ncbi:MAG: hypothetical protein WCT14_17045 [Treponemataceae bacterium]
MGTAYTARGTGTFRAGMDAALTTGICRAPLLPQWRTGISRFSAGLRSPH